MSIDNCNRCDKRLDTDFAEYQADGSLLCDGCLDDLEAKPEPDWKAIAGTLAEALRCTGYHETCWCLMLPRDHEGHTQACKRATAALAKYEQEGGE
jgi:hypothetical protein